MKSLRKYISMYVFTEEMTFIKFLKVWILSYFKYFSFCCDKMSDKDNLKRKGLVLACGSRRWSSLWQERHGGKSGRLASHNTCTPSKQRVRPGYKTSGIQFLAGRHLLKFCDLPKQKFLLGIIAVGLCFLYCKYLSPVLV